jgi:predicted double-glycine peptidase
MQPSFSSMFDERCVPRGGSCGLLIALILLCVTSAQAGIVELTPVVGVNASVQVKSIKELKYRAVVRQQYDFSCGSAAVATLLTHHYANAVNEQDVFLAMYKKGNRAAIHREGFSLLDMKQYLDERGYQSDGLYASLDDLARVGIPAIALIEVNGYKHFVVLKGVKNGEVMVGDPAAGLKLYRRSDFEKLWTNGILFVVRSRADIAKQHFNSEWGNIARAPVSYGISRDSLTNVTLLRPGGNDF